MTAFLIFLALCFLIWKFAPNPENKRAAGMMLQMLESFHIIDSTIKLDVFSQRLDFLGQLASTLPPKADKDKCIKMALKSYGGKYPGNSVSPTIRIILNQPQIATSYKFRDEAATAFFLRACNKLKAEIKTLKTATAKQRRVAQAVELADVVVNRLISDERQKYTDCIHDELTSVSDLVASHQIIAGNDLDALPG